MCGTGSLTQSRRRATTRRDASSSLRHHLWNSHELISLYLVALEQGIGRQSRLRAVGAHVLMAAVVQQNYVTASNLLCDLLFDRSGRWRIPVVARHIPHHRLKAQFPRDAENGGSPASERRAEQI